jgi:hypothetical protein
MSFDLKASPHATHDTVHVGRVQSLGGASTAALRVTMRCEYYYMLVGAVGTVLLGAGRGVEPAD